MAAALTRRFGATPLDARIAPTPIRTLEAIALENAVEGCVRETFGALVAHWQAAHAEDSVIRAAMTRIARDETRHAALAFQVDAWLLGRLDAPARARVASARSRAHDELMAGSIEMAGVARALLGLPGLDRMRDLATRLARLAA